MTFFLSWTQFWPLFKEPNVSSLTPGKTPPPAGILSFRRIIFGRFFLAGYLASNEEKSAAPISFREFHDQKCENWSFFWSKCPDLIIKFWKNDIFGSVKNRGPIFFWQKMKKSRLSERPLLKNDHLEALKLIGDASWNSHKLNFLGDFLMHVWSKCRLARRRFFLRLSIRIWIFFSGGGGLTRPLFFRNWREI